MEAKPNNDAKVSNKTLILIQPIIAVAADHVESVLKQKTLYFNVIWEKQKYCLRVRIYQRRQTLLIFFLFLICFDITL